MGLAVLGVALLPGAAQVSPSIAPSPVAAVAGRSLPPDTAYSVVERGPNHRVWQKFSYELAPSNEVVARPHRYTELSTGMHHLVGDQWVESDERIVPVTTRAAAAAATNGQHKAWFPADIYSGTITLAMPGSKAQLRSRVLGLSYSDGTNSVLFALTTNSIGQIMPSGNQVIYTNAFTAAAAGSPEVNADVRYTYTKGAFEQDILLRGPLPDPEAFGLSPESAFLEVVTEFFNRPNPASRSQVISAVTGQQQIDENLDFGPMAMGPSHAFLMSAGQEPSSENISVAKQWLELDGRQFLVEQVPMVPVQKALESLLAPGHAWLNVPRNTLRHAASQKRNVFPRAPRIAQVTTNVMRIAQADIRQQAFVLDYITINTSQTNRVFQGDSTYFLSGQVYLFGTNVLMGGTVLKCATSGGITITPTASTPVLATQTAQYRPAVITAKDDNTVGENISGSTGNPTGYYANAGVFQIAGTGGVSLSNVRIVYAGTGFVVSGCALTLADVQFVKCGTAVSGSSGGVTVRNGLFSNVNTNFALTSGISVDAQNATFDHISYVVTSPGSSNGCSATFTNCIFASVTNLSAGAAAPNGAYNGFYASASFGVSTLSSSVSPFQTVGGGNYYLTNGSQFAASGTTNIDPALLAELRTKTTCPPLAYTNITVTNGGTWWPQAQREVSAANVAIGWAYDPLDYVFGGCTLNTNLTFGPGTAVGWFRTSSGWTHAGHGIHVGDGQSLTFSGTVTQPDYWVRCSTVQEQDRSAGYGPGGITGWTWPDFSQAPLVSMRFTRCSILAWEADHMRDDNGYLVVHARDCEFWGGGCNGYASQLNYTNCLFDDVSVWTAWNGVPSTNCSFVFQNCLMRSGGLYLGRSAPDANGNYCLWSIHDSAFDGTSTGFSDAAAGASAWTQFGYNASLNGAGRTSPTNTHDLVVSNFSWVTGPLGSFYAATNSQLSDSGSVANAGLVGLYH